MKSLRYIALGLLGLMMAGCSDFWSTESPSAMDSNVYTEATFVEQVINGIYNEFGSDRGYRNRIICGYQGLNTDVERNNKNSGKADYAIYNLGLTSADLSSSNGKDPWAYFNAQIERANDAIDGIQRYSDLDKPAFQYYLGELLFLRSYLYMEMIKFWGDVPARFDAVSVNPDVVNTPKTDRNVIYDQIRADLNRAIDLMPWSEDCPGVAKNNVIYPSKGAALALLARIDMMYAGYALRPDYMQAGGGAPYHVQLNVTDASKRQELYQEALNACGQIISKEDTKFKSDFSQVFKDLCADVTDYGKTEYLWVIGFSNGTRGQFMNYNCPKSSDANGLLKNNQSGSTNSSQMVVPTLVYDFEPGDLRKEVTVAPYEWAKDDGTGVASDTVYNETIFSGEPYKNVRVYQKNKKVSDFYLGKYRVEWMVRDRAGNDDGIDYPIVRYTDVLLMYAEASLGGITGDVPGTPTYNGIDPLAQLNRVRSRAGLSGRSALTMDNIMDERKFEFVGEYIRKYDLERWGKLKEKLVETTTRLQALKNHEGEFAQTSDSLFFKYRKDNSLQYTGSTTSVFVLDSIYGWAVGETTRPATFSKENGWVAKEIYTSNGQSELDSYNYVLYADEDLIDKRHYWPIFSVNVGASNGLLWNDYDY